MSETTPYGIRSTPQGYEVWQEWWGKKISGPYDSRIEAEAHAADAAAGYGVAGSRAATAVLLKPKKKGSK